MSSQILQWFSQLDSTMQVFWICAIVASVIFIIQNVLMLMGFGDMDADADVSIDVADPDFSSVQSAHEGTLGQAGIFSLFTLRNFINFFLGFGWGGISLAPVIHNTWLLVLASFVCGLLFVAIFVMLMRLILQLEHNGAFCIQDCVGLTASVYLRIPAHREAAGKIQVSIHGSVHELNAFTDGAFLPTGTRVKVVEVVDSGSLLVESL